MIWEHIGVSSCQLKASEDISNPLHDNKPSPGLSYISKNSRAKPSLKAGHKEVTPRADMETYKVFVGQGAAQSGINRKVKVYTFYDRPFVIRIFELIEEITA